jgi:hypothetical protein
MYEIGDRARQHLRSVTLREGPYLNIVADRICHAITCDSARPGQALQQSVRVVGDITVPASQDLIKWNCA